MSAADPRVARAEALLRARGYPAARVGVDGLEQEIAAVRAPHEEWERLLGSEGAAVAAALRGVGFRYVALDLAP